MSYGTGRFSNLELPDPTLSYVARRRIKHHDLVFEPGDPISAQQIGTRSLVKYIRARMVDFPVKPGDAVPPEAGAALLQEPRDSGATGAGENDLQQGVGSLGEGTGPGPDDLQQGIAGPEDAAPVLIEKPAPDPSLLSPTVTENPDPETMTKTALLALIDARGLPVDKRLPLAAMRAKVAAALKR